MNPEEYIKWRGEAAICLSFKYSPKEIEIILSWFDTIRGSEEKDMIGDRKFDGMVEFLTIGIGQCTPPTWLVYGSTHRTFLRNILLKVLYDQNLLQS
jgi:hypothetical protein